MKIAFLSQYYPPESNAPANRVSRLAQHWARAGEQVTVITGYPNHPEGTVYAGYDASRISTAFENGVRVTRLPIYAAANRGIVRRSLSYASFAASAGVFGMHAVADADVLVATSPQLLVGAAGAWLHKARWPRRHRKAPRFVLEIRDLWPDSIVAVGALHERHPLIAALRSLERALYQRADHIVVVTERFRTILEERGVAADRISVIPNGVDTDLFSPEVRPSDVAGLGEQDARSFIVCFAGTVGMAHGLGTLLDAARSLRDAHPDVVFWVVGEGAERQALEQRAHTECLTNVRFFGRVPREQVPGLLRRADVNLIMLRKSPVFESVLPSKLFESMGCGRPILLGVDGEARRVADQAGCARYFEPGDARALEAAILELKAGPTKRAELGARGARFVRAHYDRTTLAEQYRALLGEICHGSAARASVETPVARVDGTAHLGNSSCGDSSASLLAHS